MLMTTLMSQRIQSVDQSSKRLIKQYLLYCATVTLRWLIGVTDLKDQPDARHSSFIQQPRCRFVVCYQISEGVDIEIVFCSRQPKLHQKTSTHQGALWRQKLSG